MRGSARAGGGLGRARVVRCAPRARLRGPPGRRARDRGGSPAKPSSGRPAAGSSAVARASATVSSRHPLDGVLGARSLVEVTAERAPPAPRTSARMPSVRSRACFTKSISPPRTRASSRVREHAARRPPRRRRRGVAAASACSTTPRGLARRRRRSSLRAADREAVDAQRRHADADRHALAVLAAGPDAPVEREVVADPLTRASARRGRFRSGSRPSAARRCGRPRCGRPRWPRTRTSRW